MSLSLDLPGGSEFCNGSNRKTDKDISADSTTFVLTEEEYCEEILLEKEILLAKLRDDEEKANCAASGEAPDLNDTQFTKLDELLTQTQLYSEFSFEKMEDITKANLLFAFLLNWIEGETLKAKPEKKGGRGRKKGCYSGRQSEG
ncbi:ATP-dependent DNA helicase DDM1 [Raphanus sativus]|nr:ATP-dependent DNA helicase DDM1 [Raphanus sativus]